MANLRKHTITVLVDNHFGVLARVSGMFSTRGFNITSLCVGETENPAYSRMTVVLRADDQGIAQCIQQLHKLVEVIEVTDLTEESFVERELVMAKVNAPSERRSEVVELASIFRAKVVDVGAAHMIVECTGAADKITAFVDMMRSFGIVELVRTGEIAIARSAK
jgi:acetolactate synthase-1/3 small subunit